jgi:hypothetical protein
MNSSFTTSQIHFFYMPPPAASGLFEDFFFFACSQNTVGKPLSRSPPSA